MSPRILVALLALTLAFAGVAVAKDKAVMKDHDGMLKSIDAQIERAIDRGMNTLGRKGGAVKNVIVLIPDGCSQSIQTLARWYKGEALTVDSMNAGVVKHEMANSVITGSAAAATAFATGYKTTVRFLGIGPRSDDVLTTYVWPEPSSTLSYRPIATVLEAANLVGMSTGLISTSRFTHATPAGFAAHSVDRGNEHTDISETMVYNNVDLIFGGGERNLVPKSLGGKRTDEEDLLQELTDRGYAIARTNTEMQALTGTPVYGMFAWSHMSPEIDRPTYTPDEPSLSDMTAKAIELLSQNPNGFFLMVEASQVDWAGHNNDPIYMVTDFVEFDNAVKVAVDFAKMNGQTMVLAYPDHNTGGMDIGNRDYNGAYTHLTVEELIDPLKGMTCSSAALAAEISAMSGGVTVANIIAKTKDLWNIDVSTDVAQEIIDLTGVQEGQDGYTISFGYALARVLSKHYTAIGWTSHGHNAEDVPVWAYNCPTEINGMIDNTCLADMVFDGLGINKAFLNQWLFVDLDTVVNNWTLDQTDPENPIVHIDGSWGYAEFPVSKNVLKVTTKWGASRTQLLPGVTVYAANTNRVYVSQWAIWLLWLYGLV